MSDLLSEMANALRVLSADMVQRANSGHPGMPLGMADVATVLWRDYLRHDPENPGLPNRDRFVLSNGHGSALLYALLHLSGYALSRDELQNFRQKDSITPGHPEHGLTPGVEATTGPLGQGLANGVGMALAGHLMAQRFNRASHTLFDHYTYVFAGDGCLMEGISHEACSLAGHWGLNKLIVFYDDNGISIDGEVSGWCSDDTAMRFRSYDWDVVDNVDGHDTHQISAAIEHARTSEQPSLICCKTIIGYGAPNKQGQAVTHGQPLGEEETRAMRDFLGCQYGPFSIPKKLRDAWDARFAGRKLSALWEKRVSLYAEAHAEDHAELQRRLTADLPQNYRVEWTRWIDSCVEDCQDVATRESSRKCLEFYAPLFPELLGGSADLSESNATLWSGSKALGSGDADVSYLHYGVREFAMSAIANGIALHGGFIPYTGTFLVFSDYARNAVRLAAMMGVHCIFIYTHDSVGLGEDGPTHQPVEQLASLRMIPRLSVWRPADLVETAFAWQAALLATKQPTALVLSRQKTPALPSGQQRLEGIRKGGYVLFEPTEKPQAVVIATGTEVAPALQAAQQLQTEPLPVRVVSLPCVDLFEAQDEHYRSSVLPPELEKRVVVEAGHTAMWYRYAGDKGVVLGIDCFGASAPGGDLMKHFGMQAEAITAAVHKLLRA